MSTKTSKQLIESEPVTEVDSAENKEPMAISHDSLRRAFIFSEVMFALFSSTFLALLAYNFFGFNLEDRFGLIVRWSMVVVLWGWLMIFILYGIDLLSKAWKSKMHLVLQLTVATLLGGGLIYFLTLLLK